ncbi:MAG TPA: hypothetical protein VKE22_03165 [Haliangiales bacterium]|nr:hypothetical protein [Haliangiales bacterium]
MALAVVIWVFLPVILPLAALIASSQYRCLGFASAVVLVIALHARTGIAGRWRHAAKRASRTSICNVRDGRAAWIVGRVRLARTSLEAPFSGRRVCYYAASCRAADIRCDGRPNGQVESCDFLVEDGSGTALIRVAPGASFELIGPGRVVANVPEERMRAFLGRVRINSGDPRDWNLPHERVLAEGDVVGVYGIGEWEADPAPEPESWAGVGYREMPRRLVMRAPEGLRLFVSERLPRCW